MLYNRDTRFAHLLLALLKREDGLVVGDNEPYSVTDASDYTIPMHGERRGLHHAAIEIRRDLILDDKEQQAWGRCSRVCYRRRIRSWWQQIVLIRSRNGPHAKLRSPL